MKHHAARLVALACNCCVGMLESGKLFLVALAFAFELLGDFLLEDERFESVVPLLLCAIEAHSEASRVVFLLLDKGSETAVLAFVCLNLDLELLGLFGKLLCESLEFEELITLLVVPWVLRVAARFTCCFQLSSSSTRKLFLFVTLASSPSILPLRLMKSCHASIASLEY